ncbi:Sec1-like protein [Cladochytrium replicatum]|nr:Sec1-like protein [Cladochytrium replicatum]
MGTLNLRNAQRDALFHMLNFNERVTAKDSDPSSVAVSEPIWKVLIFDHSAQEIISPLVKVSDLREQGVTVHMPLNAERHPIPDVPALYFFEPTIENIHRLGDDLAKKLYDTYHINFTNAISRPLLEELAGVALSSNATSQIGQVFDQYLNYVSLEQNLFTLNLPSTYQVLNDPTSPDATIELLVNKIVTGLFSVLVTLGVVPIIKASRGNAAEMVANKLYVKLRDDLLNARNSVFADAPNSTTRPVLILLDRNMDLASMLAHTWTYSTLVHDILDMKLNRIVLTENNAKKTVDIDSNDYFWAKNAGSPFPEVAEDVDTEINRYKSDVEEITRSAGVSSLEEVVDTDMTSNAKQLQAALTALPELTERKRFIDQHMTIATTLLKSIQERQLDVFFSMEEAITKQTKATLLEAIKDPKKLPEDKLRLFLIYYLSIEEIPREDMIEYERALANAGCELNALTYVKQVRSFTKMTTTSSVVNPQASVTDGFLGRFGSIGSKITGIIDVGVTGGFHDVIAGVKNLLPSRKELPATRAVESVMDGASFVDDEYLTFDPRQARNTGTSAQKSGTRSRVTFTEAIVFVIGGGNYLEFQNSQDYASVGVK